MPLTTTPETSAAKMLSLPSPPLPHVWTQKPRLPWTTEAALVPLSETEESGVDIRWAEQPAGKEGPPWLKVPGGGDREGTRTRDTAHD